MIKCTLIEAITASVLILMSSSLECIEGQQASTDENIDDLSPHVIDRLNFIFDKSSSPCVCMERSRCPHKPANSQGIGDIRPRLGNSCKNVSDYCCPAIDSLSRKLKMCGIRVPRGSGKTMFMEGEAATNPGHGEFPWNGAILAPKNGSMRFRCGASLIHSQAVLTVGHCVINQTNDFVVRLGEYNPLAEDETLTHVDVGVLEIIVHPDFYWGALFNDIAVAILKEPVDFRPHIQPICLPTQDESVVNEKKCYVSGWGTDLERISTAFTNILEIVTLDIVPNNVCEKAYKESSLGSVFKLDRSFICAGGKRADSCLGDGGSPLICKIPGEKSRYRQVGIVSWGIGCGIYPGVYTNVPLYVDWIHQQLKKHNLTYSSTFYMDEDQPAPKF